MQAFRNAAKPVVLVLSISFFAWLVWDLSGLSGGSGILTQTSVGKINGRTIDARQYDQAVQRASDAQQQQAPGPLGPSARAQIRDQVWEQFVQATLLEGEFNRRGVQVAPAEVAEAIRSFPPPELRRSPEFQTDGQFDMTKYQAWLTSAVGQSYIPALEAQYREEILRSKLIQDLVADVYVPDAALWQEYQDRHTTARIGLATIDPLRMISDQAVAVSADEVERFYREHREEFRRQRTAFLSFVALDQTTNAADTAAALSRVEQIKAEIDSGAPFAEVARRESADTVSGNRGGDLGKWTRGSFDSTFDAAAFSLPLHRVSRPVLTRFGYHLIEITSRTGDTASGRHILVPIELAGAHRDAADTRADSLETLGAENLDGAALDTAARVLGLPVRRTEPVIEGTFAPVHADALAWAFQAKAGETSPVFEAPGTLFVYRLDSLWAAGIPALARIREAVEARARAAKKRSEAKAIADELAKQVAAGASLAEAAKGFGAQYEVLGPFTRTNAPLQSGRVLGAAFGLPVGRTSGVIQGTDQLYLLTVLERTPADSAAFQKELASERASALQTHRENYARQYFAALRAAARVTDHRAELYKTNAQLEASNSAPPGGTRGF